MSRRRILMVGVDAAEPELIERWTDDGTLPNLARLRACGSYRRLASSAAWLAGSPWPSFYTGTSPAEHGFYHFLQWRPERMRMARPSPAWLPIRPFWRALGSSGARCLVIDAPSTYPPEPFDGVEISGWATHDHLYPPASHPPGVLTDIRHAFGGSPLPEEALGLQSLRALLALRDDLLHTVRCVTDASLGLMRRERWDLCLVTFAATHRGGHKLWDASGARGTVGQADDAAMFEALRDLYRACDAAIGRLVDAAGEDTLLLVFSLHGMGPNTARAELLPALLRAVLEGRAAGPEPRPGLQRLRRLVPVEFRHEVKRRLPQAWQDRLTRFWRTPPGSTADPAFSLQADQQGYVRVNLRRREAAGTVEPGAELDRLLCRIAHGLKTFQDADSGEPLVADVVRAADVLPAGRRSDLLPDLIVRWSDIPASRHQAVRSAEIGAIPWPAPGRNPDGRAGNHRGEGFLIAAGGGLPAVSVAARADIRDLAPTVCALLGTPTPWPMEGRPIPLLVAGWSTV